MSNMSAMTGKYEAATRHLPIAHGRQGTGESGALRQAPATPPRDAEARRLSETRLKAAVVADRTRDDKDPYADVPCTD